VRKSWETVGAPRLVVIGEYRMGFTLTPVDGDTNLSVWIDYALPASGISRMLGWLFSRGYARWCTTRMLRDAQSHFAAASSA
jgi:hypothetical protein